MFLPIKKNIISTYVKFLTLLLFSFSFKADLGKAEAGPIHIYTVRGQITIFSSSGIIYLFFFFLIRAAMEVLG